MAEQDMSVEDTELFAAEYVIGVLDAQQLRAARHRLRTDRSFADEVAAWEGRFAAWFHAFEPVAAPADGWDRLQRSLGWAPHTQRVAVPPRAGGGFWRGLALGGFALASVFAIALLFTLRRPPVQLPAPPPVVQSRVVERMVQPDMVASIATDDGRPMLVASVDSGSGAMTLAPTGDMDVPAGRAAELWLIPAGGTPRSLGVFDPRHAGRMVVPEAMRGGLSADAQLAVSIEPAGGSPTGSPTGPVVASGSMRSV